MSWFKHKPPKNPPLPKPSPPPKRSPRPKINKIYENV